MWMDSKLVKDLVVIKQELLDQYLDENKDKELRKTSITKIGNAIACLVLNLAYVARLGRSSISITLFKNEFSKPVIYNCVNTGRKISYMAFYEVLEWMCGAGYITVQKGGVVTWKPNTTGGTSKVMPDRVEPTLVEFSEYLISKVTELQKKDICNIPTIPDVVQMRDENKKVIEKALGREEKKLVHLLNKYNFFTRKFDITVGDCYYDIQLRKVFNNSSFKQGGRSYVTGESSSIMKRSFRKEIRINGNPTVEIDFKSLHPSLIAEIGGYQLPEGFDPYGIELDGYDKSVLRKICKIAFLCMFNCKCLNQAISAVSNELKTLKDDDGVHLPSLWKKQELVPAVIEVKLILQELAMHNMYANEWLFSGKGVNLQNIDSRIMDLVIQQFLDVDEFMLPVHDSIIVEERLKEFGETSMKVAYKQVLGTDMNCKLETK